MTRTISTLTFTVNHKNTGLPVNKREIANETFNSLFPDVKEELKNPYENTGEDFFNLHISSNGELMFTDGDNDTYVIPKEGKYIIAIVIGADEYEVVY